MPRAIIVHGGAGDIDAAHTERRPRCQAGCERAAQAGWAALAAGGMALDAVVAAVAVLEDDPEFNAGYGAALNRSGEVEVDAAVMDGALRVGAVGAVPWLRHPVHVARRVLEEGRHALLVGPGALAFAAEHGIHPEAPDALVTERARQRLAQELARQTAPPQVPTGDTVGACAVDDRGHVAAATSTGGLAGKRPGRVGDTPLVGAGTYADDRAGAASATGHGESILRVLMTRVAVERLAAGDPPEVAARHAVAELEGRVQSRGGIILVDVTGRVGQARNTPAMSFCAIVDGQLAAGA